MARFRRIKKMIKDAKSFGINIDADDNIVAFKKYLSGNSESYEVSKQTRGASVPVTLIPFYVRAFGNQYRHSSKMSGRASQQMTTMGLSQADLNIDAGGSADGGDAGTTATTAAVPGRKVRGFDPAKVIVTIRLETPITGKKSGITLLDYTRTSGESYTYPFGARDEVGGRTYPEMTGKLLSEAGRGNRTVSFKQETPGR